MLNFNCLKTTSTRVRSEFFSEHIITVWNGLAVVTDFRSLARFKNIILATDFAAHLKCFSSHFILLFVYLLFSFYMYIIHGQLLVHSYALLSCHAAYVKCFINHVFCGK